MTFDDPAEVEALFYDLKINDAPRGADRARIDQLFGGAPPYSPSEVEENGISVNCNYLEGVRLSQAARSSFASAFQVSGNFFRCTTDSGPVHKRQKYSEIVTREMNRPMKRSIPYFEGLRSKFALNVLHGIAPAVWRDRDEWCPETMGIDDVLIPANTLLTMRNLPLFFVYHQFTAPELIRLTRGPKVDPGWNISVVDACLKWLDEQTALLRGNQWPNYWSPEKWEERVKEGGAYAGDAVPTIDCADFYYWHDDGKESGWYRKIILDSWGSASLAGGVYSMSRDTKKDFAKEKFLYDGKKRIYGNDRQEIISFQFADLSAKAPFRYHSVRSLGYLMFAICHLQNRLRCKFHESVLESLMMLFRVKDSEESQRVLKLNIINKGFIDKNIQFIPANERFQANAGFVELGLRDNQQIIDSNASSYMPTQNYSKDNIEKTKYQVSAELNATTSLVSSSIQQAASYYTFECMEVKRRFMKKGNQNHDVRTFRANCLKAGVPEDLLIAEAWDVAPEKMMGGGNQSLQTAIAQELMQARNAFDPSAQREILRDWTLAITQDAARADRFVPEQPQTSNSVHDAELAFGTLMQGAPVTPKSGLNAAEVAGTIISLMGLKVQQITALEQGVGTPQEVIGLQLCAQYAGAFIQQLAADETMKPIVKNLGDGLGKIMNEVKAMAQRQQEQAQKQNGNGVDPEAKAKVDAMMIQAQVKAENARTSHAEKTAQRRISFEQKTAQEEQKHAMELQKDSQLTAAEIASLAAKTAAEVEATKVKSENQPPKENGAQ